MSGRGVPGNYEYNDLLISIISFPTNLFIVSHSPSNFKLSNQNCLYGSVTFPMRINYKGSVHSTCIAMSKLHLCGNLLHVK